MSKLPPSPTLDDLPPLIASFDGAGLRVVYETSGTVLPLGDRPTIALYRTVQEALTNAHKHGDGAATVRLAHHADEVEVEITNRVAAGPTAAPASGFGLVGMRERVQSAGGRLTTGARPEGTFVVHARFPRSRMQESS